MATEILPDLVKMIQDAFAEVPYPGDKSIGRYEVEIIIGKRHPDITIGIINSIRSELPFFYAEGFHYYLPDFLIAVILHANDLDTFPESLVDTLAPGFFGELSTLLRELVVLMTNPQKKAVYEFLKKFTVLYPSGTWNSPWQYYKAVLDNAIAFWYEQVNVKE